jgi:hypothetical protein
MENGKCTIEIVEPQHAAALRSSVYGLWLLLMVVIMSKMQMGMGMRFFIIMIMMVGMYQIGIEQ